MVHVGLQAASNNTVHLERPTTEACGKDCSELSQASVSNNNCKPVNDVSLFTKKYQAVQSQLYLIRLK